jgi:hypothetical protein
MKGFVFSCCFFLSSLFSFAQNCFPQDFIGHWEGTLNWYRPGNKEPQQVKMQLIIKAADSANTFHWQIVYGDKGQDNRPYLLKPVDTAKGHWQIDERNGIILDQYFVGGRFTSTFTVQSTTIVSSCWREGDKLVVEFFGLTAKAINTTGLGTEESPQVASYGTKSYQRAVMGRKER